MLDLGKNFDALSVALGIARRAGASERLLEAATAELAELTAIAAMVDQRRLETFQRGRRIERLRSQGRTRSQICESLHLSADQHDRATCAVRLAYGDSSHQHKGQASVDLKSTSLGIGAGTPAPLSKYGSAKRPTVPKDATPRDGGGLANGETGGNYDGAYMAKVTVNGAGSADAAAASAAEKLQSNAK